MDRRRFLLASLAGALVLPRAARAQERGKVLRMGYLGTGRAADQPFRPVLEQALRERGWALGDNLIIEYRFAEDKFDRLPALAAELVRLDPQVIVAATALSTRAVKNATSTIPIVMWGVGDPVGQGFISSFARPGGNVTGFTDTPVSTYAKQLHLLREAVPRARRMAFLANPANPAALLALKEPMDEAARALGVKLQVVDRSPEAFDAAFVLLAQVRTEALLVMDDPGFFRHFSRLAELALRHRLPTMCGNWNFAKAGGLMNYSVDRAGIVRQVAAYVDRILRGAKAADLPVEQPSKFDFVVNLKTAKALRLTVPQALLVRADRVLE